uniref:Fibrinogen C-terminal domain-containing protein n=1 Tax=Myripristis murdjan TaxID=586833 RepID=A0A667WAX0_9TELE
NMLLYLDVYSQFYLPIDCDDIYRHDNSSASGVYTVFPGGPTSPLHAHRDVDTDGGGWTLIQRRMDGTQNFYRPWKHYKEGFGNVANLSYVLSGLENIFLLTVRKKNELRVDMEDWEGGKAYAHYASFSIDPESYSYQPHLGSFTGGDAGVGLAVGWYNTCHYSNPNGMYAPTNAIAFENSHVIWQHWKGWNDSHKSIAMKIRAVSGCKEKHRHKD